MTGLFDTHTFMWWDASSAKLSPAALAFIRDPANTLLLSVVSVWEIVIKIRLGKLSMNRPLRDVLSQHRGFVVVFFVDFDFVVQRGHIGHVDFHGPIAQRFHELVVL